jgi:hypothetical protein
MGKSSSAQDCPNTTTSFSQKANYRHIPAKGFVLEEIGTMNRDRGKSTTIQCAHEALFSANIAFVFMALVFQSGSQFAVSRLNSLEFAFNRLLHIRQTDFLRGYWEFFLPGIALAVVIFVTLRLFPAHFSYNILRSLAGISAVTLAPALFCVTYFRSHGWNPFGTALFCELLVALFCVLLYLYGKWPTAKFGSLIILLLHYAFWFWQFSPFFAMFLSGWGGAVAVVPVVGLCSSLAWMLYLANLEPLSTSKP